MQIEEVFRDEKGPRLGWSLRHARTDSPVPWCNLLLVATVALYAGGAKELVQTGSA